jgi:hypothetical protein
MKIKFVLTILTMLLGTICLSQDVVEIKGTISSSDLKGIITLVKNAEIIINKSDNSTISTLSNDSGQYNLKVAPFAGTGTVSIRTSSKTKDVKGYGLAFLASKETFTLDLSQPKVYIKDFSLVQFIICRELPSIRFKFNSTDTYWKKNPDLNAYNNESPEDAISYVYQLLVDNPDIAVKITGHCDAREKNKDTLSLARANYIAGELIKKGIPKERVTAKGSADFRQIIRSEEIKRAKTNEEKEALHQINRRAVFTTENYEYKGK